MCELVCEMESGNLRGGKGSLIYPWTYWEGWTSTTTRPLFRSLVKIAFSLGSNEGKELSKTEIRYLDNFSDSFLRFPFWSTLNQIYILQILEISPKNLQFPPRVVGWFSHHLGVWNMRQRGSPPFGGAINFSSASARSLTPVCASRSDLKYWF